jgi:hypothetical protein
MGAVGNRLVALGLIGVIGLTTSCSGGGKDAGSPTTVLRRESPTVPSTPGTSGVANGESLRTVNWSGVTYPMDCGASGTVNVRDVEYATPANDVEVAVVEVSCHVVATAPPSALFVYEPTARGSQPRLLQALVNYTDGWLFYVFRTSVGVVTAAVAGYSTVDVGSATPDVSATLKWMWQGSGYRLVSSVPSHARFCVTGPCAPTVSSGGS